MTEKASEAEARKHSAWASDYDAPGTALDCKCKVRFDSSNDGAVKCAYEVW